MLLVFISHSSADRQFVESELIPLLKRHGIPCWYSPADIKTASDWEASIRRALTESEWFLVVLSPNSICSEWVKTEVHWALENRRDHVVPVLIADCEPGDLHLKLQRLQYVDYRHAVTTARQKIIDAIGAQWVENGAEELSSAALRSRSSQTLPSETAGAIVHDLGEYGGYEIISTLARTGVGVVLLARHAKLKTDVVVKTYALPFLSSTEVTDLQVRIKDRARLVHPAVVSIQEVFSVGSRLHVVTEHFQSSVNVWEYARCKPLSSEQAVELLTQVVTGLSYAHRFGIVHGAIDPHSVLVGPGGRAKLSGLDSLPINEACDKHVLKGTLRYVAPEQLLERPSSTRTDVWLLGVVLYEMIMGEPPFSDQYELLSYMGRAASAPVWREKKQLSFDKRVPKWMQTICERCLQVEEDARYSDASELLRALRSADSHEGLIGRLFRT